MGSFESMDKDVLRAITSRGGKAGHAKGTAHEWDTEAARLAGRKGGETVSRDREHMAEIGRRGGCKHQRGVVQVTLDGHDYVQCKHCSRLMYAVIAPESLGREAATE